MNENIELDDNGYLASLEAILFASGKPVPIFVLSNTLSLSIASIEEYLNTLIGFYNHDDRGIQLVKVNDSYQLTTKSVFDTVIKSALSIDKKNPISKSAMEVLAIIAYNTPCTRGYVDKIRGVDSGYLFKSLLDKGLIEEYGRLNLPGKPMGYKTTDLFLTSFNLTSVSDLKQLPNEILNISDLSNLGDGEDNFNNFDNLDDFNDFDDDVEDNGNTSNN